MNAEFAHRVVPRIGKRLFRLGLSGSSGLDEAAAAEALERVQYMRVLQSWRPEDEAPAWREQ